MSSQLCRFSFAVGVLALATLGPACSDSAHSSPPASAPPVAVTTATVHYSSQAPAVHASGVLANKGELRASFKTGGIVARVAVDEGQQIKRGQVLATLSTAEIDAGVEQATLAVTKAERDQKRVQQLFDGKAATREQLDDVTTGVSVARAQLRAVQFNRNHAVIVAPSNGRVVKRLAEPNELVGPGQPVMLLALDDAGWVVRGAVSDKSVVRLRTGDAAAITLQALAENGALQASVSELAVAASPPLGTFEIELRLDPAHAQHPALRAGMIADVVVKPTPQNSYALVPAAALRDGDGKRAAVWTVDANNHVQRIPVTVAYFDGDQAALAAGLPEGARIVVEGAAYVTAASSVQIIASAGVP